MIQGSVQTRSLNGRWSLSRAGEDTLIAGRVPGTVHQDLLRAGQLEDPYYRDQELQAQWVGQAKWRYSRAFTVSKSFLKAPRVLLIAAGLDTLATIELNGRLLGQTDNMYRTWEFDVRSRLEVGTNHISITFAPVLPYLESKESIEPRMVGWTSARLHNAGWLRKEPCNFGWDWGPQLLTCGIWRSIDLVAIETARIHDVDLRQSHRSKSVDCAIAVGVEQTGDQPLRVSADLTYAGASVARAEASVKGGRACCRLRVKHPHLWWPNGLGDQPLYQLRVALSTTSGQLLHEVERRIGLRRLSLRTRPDRWGESFEFVVNSVPFFAKGANWIPADTFAPRVTRADYRRLLSDARLANMNMLRVWGGGVYEADAFYDLCDELGLCVWQDFMFACGTYPAYDVGFMANVRKEASDNVRRLRHHACLALLCGNNELEQGLVAKSWTPTSMSWSDYDKLFNELLPEVVAELAPDTCYWPGSPHTPGEQRADFNNPDRGDAHLWGVWHGKQPFEWYRTCQHRFVSEFGFQSFPHPKTVRSYTAPADRNITSWVMEHHQRSPIGNTTIVHHMTEWFLLPKDFESTLWLSQIQQGMAMKYACEHWRRNMPRSMGALYWQLNDCWPVASWSSIDRAGRYKALHYMAARFFAPLLVSGVEDQAGNVAVYVNNDRREALNGKLGWQATTAAGKHLARGELSVTIQGGGSSPVTTLDFTELLARHSPRDLLVWLELSEQGRRVSENLVSFARPKHLLLLAPELRYDIRARGDGFQVTLRAKHVALWCWLDLDRADAHFSDNFVHLRPGRNVKLTVTPAKPMSLSGFKRQLSIRHLGSTHSRA